MKRAIVAGCSGFIGNHMVHRLKSEGYYVRGFDIKMPEFRPFEGDDFYRLDLREMRPNDPLFSGTTDGGAFGEVYQFACNMGGMGFLGDASNDAAVLRDNALINLRVLDACKAMGNKPLVFFASSACVYQDQPFVGMTDGLKEAEAYPAQPDLEYGWEKLFSERLYAAYGRQGYIQPRVARFHNVYGPYGTWQGGREKAPAAICRKVAQAPNGSIDVWGDGQQTRSFLYIDEAIEGVRRLMRSSDFEGPVNIGSSELVTIDALVDLVCDVAHKPLTKNYIPGPVGVRGRNSDNTLIGEKLKWKPTKRLRWGLEHAYRWVSEQVRLASEDAPVG